MANPAPTINQINAFNATQGTTIDFNIIGGTELVRSNRIYIYDLSDNSLICTHLYVSTESIHELPANTDSSIVYESGKSSADFVNGAQYYAQIQTYTDTIGTQGGSGLSVAKMFWCLVDPTLTITTIPSTISTTSYNVSATYNANTSVVSNIIQQYQFSLYSATGSLLQSSGVIVGSGTQQGTSTAYDISYNFTGLSVGSSYYVVVDVTTTQGMSVSTQSNTFTVSIDTPTLGEATVINNACDGYISVTSNLSGEYGGSASGEIATFETDSVNDVSSLKVTLTPQQDATPWIGTDHDTTPYLHRAMPTQSNDYNRESGVIVGGTVAWNQRCTNGDFSNRTSGWTSTGGELTADNNVGSFVASQSLGFANKTNLSTVSGHKYITLADVKISSGVIEMNCAWASKRNTKTGVFETIGVIWQSEYTGNSLSYPRFYDRRESNWDAVLIKNVRVHDLTAMFGTTIADYIYNLEQANAGAGVAWFRKYFPEDYYPYHEASLESVQATAHKTYDGDGNVLGNYALDSSLTLRGIPKLDASNNLYYDGDEYESDGTVTRKYGIVDLGTLTWGFIEPVGSFTYGYFYANVSGKADGLLNFITAKYPVISSLQGGKDKSASGQASGNRIFIADSAYTDAASFKTAMSGVYLVYELATPTTETAQAYTNPQIVDPDGTEEYVTANSVPVGHDSTYSLVCPISGYDEVSANVVGKNLFGGQYGVRFSVFIPANTAFTASAKHTSGSARIDYFDADGNRIDWFGLTSGSERDTRTITSTEDVHSVLFTGTETTEYQIELGSTATDYEPYQGQTYTADLPQTVYGGTVDLVSGEVVIDRAMIEPTTVYSVSYSQGTGLYYCVVSLTDKAPSDNVAGLISDQFHSESLVAIGNCYITNFGQTIVFILGDQTITTKAQASAWLTANKPQFCYELSTPQTIQLTPQEIQTLVGTNNVWSDSGDVEITYNIPITNLLVKRQDVADVSGTWLTLYSQPVTQASDMDFTFIDFLNQYGKTYKYALVPLLTQTQSGVEVEVEGGYTVSDEVQSIFDGVFIADQTGSQKCKANVGYGDVDMNQAVGTITPIGSKYPVVITNSKNQYHNGSITGTIVPDDYYSNGNLSRIDMVNKRNELEQFLTNKRAKIIKDWNSNIWLVMIMENINCTFNNEYGMGIVNFTANWIEVGDPTNQQDLQATGLIDVGGA